MHSVVRVVPILAKLDRSRSCSDFTTASLELISVGYRWRDGRWWREPALVRHVRRAMRAGILYDIAHLRITTCGGLEIGLRSKVDNVCAVGGEVILA